MKKLVIVQWYGHVVQGELVEKRQDGTILDNMQAVRIPVQGVQIVALFHPKHIYASTEELIEKTKKEYNYPKEFPKPEEIVHAAPKKTLPSETWQCLQEFKTAHWDDEHNHLNIDALDEFYDLWRMSVAQKRHIDVQDTASAKPAPVLSAEAMMIIPSSGNEKIHKEDQPQAVVPRTIGKKVTITEPSLF